MLFQLRRGGLVGGVTVFLPTQVSVSVVKLLEY